MRLIIILFLFLLAHTGYAKDLPCAIPGVLKELGFTIDDLVNYRKAGNTEFFYFPDSTTIDIRDTIVFIIENKKIKEVFKEKP